MKPKVTWVLIADGAQAKVFEHAGPGAGLIAVPELMFGQDPQKARDLVSDRPGRSFSSVGSGRSGYEPPTDPVQMREARFVQSVAETLEAKRRAGAFDRLVIAAAPTALGDLRPHLSKELQQAVIAELPKDFTNLPTPKLESALGDVLAM